jgi:hypothetical protein
MRRQPSLSRSLSRFGLCSSLLSFISLAALLMCQSKKDGQLAAKG